MREYDEDLTVLAYTSIEIIESGAPADPLNAWTNKTKTIGGIGSGADVILDADTTCCDIYIRHTGNDTTFRIDELKLLGESVTLEAGFEWPISQNERLIQKAGFTGSGEVIATSSYGLPLKRFVLDLKRLGKVDYLALKGFLESADIDYGQGTLILTDDQSNEYFGKFIGDEHVITGDFYLGASAQLVFQELPY